MKSEKDLYQDALMLMWLLLHERERECEQSVGTVIRGCVDED